MVQFVTQHGVYHSDYCTIEGENLKSETWFGNIITNYYLNALYIAESKYRN